MLNWGFCLPGSGKYTGRKVRFAVDYSSLPTLPILNDKITSLKGFVNNTKDRRISISLNQDKITRCDLSTKLITDDPIAEYFYNEFINANIKNFGSYQEVQKYIRFYCLDEQGLDIPLIPSINDLTSNTGLEEIKSGFKIALLPIGLGLGIYFYFKTKGKKK